MRSIYRRPLRIGLSIVYFAAGFAHIAFPTPFLMITPNWVPDAPTIILVTGLCELAGAVGLQLPSVRPLAAIGLALYAVCVFPANIKHAIDSLAAPSPSALQWSYHVIRLPLQPLLVWLTLYTGEVTSWPCRRVKIASSAMTAAQVSGDRLFKQQEKDIPCRRFRRDSAS